MGTTDHWSATVYPLPRDFYHIYKYIHKYITYKSESGRQVPTEAQLTQLHVSGILGRGAGFPEKGSKCFLLHRVGLP